MSKIQVDYIDHMGTDLTVVNAARVSFNKNKTVFDEKDERLIGFLARNNHWTPFGHPQITIRETVPIFVARQRFKHTIGFVYNEMSRRYVSDEPDFFEPEGWRQSASNVKQGSSDEFVPEELLKKDMEIKDYPESILHALDGHLADSLWLYKYLLEIGVAPEQARMILPQSTMTSYYVTGSLSAWTRAYNLRIHNTAQKEIREVAKYWKDIIEPLFPVSWKNLTVHAEEN